MYCIDEQHPALEDQQLMDRMIELITNDEGQPFEVLEEAAFTLASLSHERKPPLICTYSLIRPFIHSIKTYKTSRVGSN